MFNIQKMQILTTDISAWFQYLLRCVLRFGCILLVWWYNCISKFFGGDYKVQSKLHTGLLEQGPGAALEAPSLTINLFYIFIHLVNSHILKIKPWSFLSRLCSTNIKYILARLITRFFFRYTHIIFTYFIKSSYFTILKVKNTSVIPGSFHPKKAETCSHELSEHTYNSGWLTYDLHQRLTKPPLLYQEKNFCPPSHSYQFQLIYFNCNFNCSLSKSCSFRTVTYFCT